MSAPRQAVEHDNLTRAEHAFAAGDYQAVAASLSDHVERGDATARMYLLLSRTFHRQGKAKDAVAAAEKGCSAFSRDKKLRTQLGRLLLKLDQVDAAEQVFAQACADFPSETRMHALHADACLLAGKNQQALNSIEHAIELDQTTAEYQARQVAALCALGKLAEARAMLAKAEAGAAGLLTICQGIVSYAAKHDRKVEALVTAGNACALMPDAATAWLTYAECLVEAGRGEDALKTLDRATRASAGFPSDAVVEAQRLRGRALRLTKDDEGAIAAYQAVLDAEPDDETALRELYVLNQRLGREAERRSYGKMLSAAGAKALPATLDAGLKALDGQTVPLGPPNEKTKWAWEIASRPEEEYDGWRAAVQWGQAADRLLRAWWLNAPERAGEIDALIDPPSPNPLDTLPKGARCVAVTTHLGVMGGQVRFLETCGRPFRGFGVSGPDPVVDGKPPMRIAQQGNSPAALRELIAEIERGTLIGFAADVPDFGAEFSAPFLGRTVALSTFVPRLIFKYQTKCLWWQALWRDGRIAIQLDYFPDPNPRETIEAWCRRWCAAYLEKIAPVMQGAPENLVLGAGIWRNASADSARRWRRPQNPPAKQRFA